MNPAMFGLILSLVEEAIKLEPTIQKELHDLFSKKDATLDDWAAMRARIVAKRYSDYDPNFVQPPAA
jgi:hypothetical protein